MKKDGYEELIDRVVGRIYEQYPELKDKYGEVGVRKCREDNEHHLKHLETAYELENDQFFYDYVQWLNGILQKHGMSADHLVFNLKVLAEEVGSSIEDRNIVVAYKRQLTTAVEQMRA